MSWNTQVLFVETGEAPADLAALIDDLGVLGEPAATGEIDFLGAASMAELTDVAAVHVDGWVVIAGLPVALAGGFDEASAEAPIVVMMLGGAASVYAFSVYRGGKSVRELVEQEGAIIRDEGEPLEEEDDLDGFDYTEAQILEIVSRLTLPLEVLEPLTFETFTGVPPFN